MDVSEPPLEVPEVKEVMVLAGTGPTQPVMSDVVTTPVLDVRVSVPKKAKEVRIEPVLLLMAMVSGAVMVVPGVQLEQPVPANEADTISRSFEVQRSGDGKSNPCASAFPENRNPAINSSRKCSQLEVAPLAKAVDAK
jgi:hypothetical protein